ncbi:MAG TPA: FtsW/RodA/SpoVE family cell cycle protein [Bacilli bacterium]|nr:FtsW/RodA/SpoVE family cell cycle protein [Bacilli bacterium]
MTNIFKKIDKPLFFITIFMFLFGLIMIFSASYVKAINSLGNAYYYLIRQGVILFICFIVFLILIKFPIKVYKKFYKTIMFIAIALLILVYFFGNISNGARSWFALPYFNLQPSELVKIAIIIFMAVYYDNKKENMKGYKVALFPFVFIAIIFGLIVIQPDLGSALIILFMTMIIFFSVPLVPEVKKSVSKIILITITLLSVAVVILVLSGKTTLYEYQIQRLNFLNPCSRYTETGTGYQICNSYIAINNGGLFGVGIGNSTQKYLYLPEAYTDFIFPVIVEELGLITGIIILLIYAYIIFRILSIAKRSYNLTNGLICYGVAAYMFVHIFINLGGVLGLLPLTGVPLPFLSYGGSYALSLTVALTLVQRVNIETYSQNQREKLKKI